MLRLGQFAIWPFAEKQNDPNAHLQFINSARNAVVPNSPFFPSAVVLVLERAFVLYYCHQSKYRSFLLDFCMHLSNEARRRRELKAYKKLEVLFFR